MFYDVYKLHIVNYSNLFSLVDNMVMVLVPLPVLAVKGFKGTQQTK